MKSRRKSSRFVVTILNLLAWWLSPLNAGRLKYEPIQEHLFTLPLAPPTAASSTLLAQESKMPSKSLLEPIIIHHKAAGGGGGGALGKSQGLCEGACITPRVCDYHGGTPNGHCLTGSICCQFERSCGGVSREKVSFFQSPQYPNALNYSLDCNFQIHPIQDSCALRIEFLEFKLARSVVFASKVEKCLLDALYILNSDDGANEPLCDMESHTAVVYFKPGSTKPLTLLVVAQSDSFKWNLKITQVNCKKLPQWKNEPGCGRQLMFEAGEEIEGSAENAAFQNAGAENAYIVNGEDAEGREFPWQVSLQSVKGNHRCGAAVISPTALLTAAHCVARNGYDAREKFKVVVGVHNLQESKEGADPSPGIEYEIKNIFQNFHYKPTSSYLNDIAIIQLAKGLTFSPKVQPICLPPEDFITTGKQGWVSGWGRLNGSDPSAKAKVLQKLKVEILTNEVCDTLVKQELEAIRKTMPTLKDGATSLGQTKSQLCARAPLHSAVCFGDSGGPLVIQNEEDGSFTQVGVVSFGIGKCITDRNPPAAYTRVSEFLRFISIATASTF